MNNPLSFILTVIFGTIFNLLVYPVFIAAYLKIYFWIYETYPNAGGVFSVNNFTGNLLSLLIYTSIISIMIGFLLSLIIVIRNPKNIYQGIIITLLLSFAIGLFFQNPITALINLILHQSFDDFVSSLSKLVLMFGYYFFQIILTGIFVTKLNFFLRLNKKEKA